MGWVVEISIFTSWHSVMLVLELVINPKIALAPLINAVQQIANPDCPFILNTVVHHTGISDSFLIA
jgi:hypothetical protein